MMQMIKQAVNLAGKTVLMRADFDVAVNPDGTVREAFRARRQKRTLDFLAKHGARVILVAHISGVRSFANVIDQLSAVVGRPLRLLTSLEEKDAFLGGDQPLALLDNIRLWPGEKENDDAFAARLAGGFDIYVNNAFAVCHRNHASVAAITSHLPAYAGMLIEEEINALEDVVSAPRDGKVVLISGAKGETKAPAVRYLLDKAEIIIVGGAVAHDILKMKGQNVGASVADDNAAELLAGVDVNDPRIVLPVDFVVSDGKFLDIGEKTIELFSERLKGASLVVWNGPFGAYEDMRYRAGTVAVAQAILASGAKTIIGGGDTVSALDRTGLLDKFSFVSTGGGAMLMFLAEQELPGLGALGYYD